MRKLLMTVLFTGLLTALASAQVTICHVPPGNPENAQTITVGEPAVEAHLTNHSWDHLGPCEVGPTSSSGMVFVLLAAVSAAAFLLYRRTKGYQT